MQLRCVLCQRYCEVDDRTPMAKRAREDPGFVFVCPDCQRRNVERFGIREERANPVLRGRRFRRVFS